MKWWIAALLTGAGLAVGGAIRRRNQSGQFRDRVIVITGGSRGLGLALAREFGRRGARLALIARDPDELRRARKDLQGRGIRVSTWTCDLRTAEPIRRTIAAIAAQEREIDGVVNNAGTMLVAPLDLMDDTDFSAAMDLHFWAPYHLVKAALPHLRRSGFARVVNIASIGGRVAVPHMAPYAASKFALVGFSDALRSELAAENIRVTTVSPGLMRTGSHINACFKGDIAKEFAWFATSAALPLGSVSAERAARRIVSAAHAGRPELTVGCAAKSLRIFQAMFPRSMARAIAAINRFLPGVPPFASRDAQSGSASRSGRLPAWLTWLADRAIPRFNEQPQTPG